MSDFGFSKGGDKRSVEPAPAETPSKIDLGGMPRGPVVNDRDRERDAMQRAESVGFTDRGQGRGITKRVRQKKATAEVFVKGPEELIEWFVEYTNDHGHSAYWKSIADFRALVEASEREK